ncbi:glycine C-acetyltransferase [Sphingomonas sp. UYAg733]
MRSRASFYRGLAEDLAAMELDGLLKPSRVLTSRQGTEIRVRTADGERDLLNICANDYLGLAADPRVMEAAREATVRWGSGTASVRFICGTLAIHEELEAAIARYVEKEDALLFAACFDANGGVFEPLLNEQDAIVSDALNHASIIDGIRLCKAKRYRYARSDLDDLERQVKSARDSGARTVLIATDGVFSMDGHVARLAEMAKIADRFEALMFVDDCHATGHLGPGGRGSGALLGVAGSIDILSGTFGKTLGGAMGGWVAGPRSVIDTLRQRARPYLFSNALAPGPCGSALAAIEIASSPEGDLRRETLMRNATTFRAGMEQAGFDLLPGDTPIVPVMFRDAPVAVAMAQALFANGVFATAFAYPVVPLGEARIRVQLSAGHSEDQVTQAISAFVAAREMAS